MVVVVVSAGRGRAPGKGVEVGQLLAEGPR